MLDSKTIRPLSEQVTLKGREFHLVVSLPEDTYDELLAIAHERKLSQSEAIIFIINEYARKMTLLDQDDLLSTE